MLPIPSPVPAPLAQAIFDQLLALPEDSGAHNVIWQREPQRMNGGIGLGDRNQRDGHLPDGVCRCGANRGRRNSADGLTGSASSAHCRVFCYATAARSQSLFEALLRGENTISGFRNRDLRRQLPELSAGQASRTLKRLRLHGLIKRVGRTYKYYITTFGRRVLTLGLKLVDMVVIPQLARPSTADT